MGLIKNNYEVSGMGIVLPTAYAQIETVNVEFNGETHVKFAIQRTREDIVKKQNIESVKYCCKIDKELPIYRQIYEKAKEEIFSDWEDDIIE